jgi:hypothetical protein
MVGFFGEETLAVSQPRGRSVTDTPRLSGLRFQHMKNAAYRLRRLLPLCLRRSSSLTRSHNNHSVRLRYMSHLSRLKRKSFQSMM